ncbi:MAG: UDP-N-acetylmuramoyl-tripeptide--D-alanyl-D-alanine ligase [Clostridiales bacterium]|nr:UDP-N-acetylmuramoyl-tripeptide--D-alanyl-D-alanine ligase [Clostridiales bacterium]
MEKLYLSKVANWVGGVLHGTDCELFSVSTDTRTIEAGSLFIPLKGDRFNGHSFIGEAVEKGAAAFFSEESNIETTVPYVVVLDTNQALLTLAERYKAQFPVKTVGITGSVGKTTTKEMTASVLSQKYKTLKTEGNFNNLIGLPLTVIKLDQSYEATVLEMGMSNFGEISQLTKVAKPDIAVITAVGVAHIEFLGSREGILKAKLEILEGLKEGGSAVLNGDEPLLYRLKGTLPQNTVYYGWGNPECDITAFDIDETSTGLSFTVKANELEFRVNLNVPGMHNVNNALAAVACGLHFGLSTEEIQEGLLSFRNVGMRQNIYQKNGFTIIEDCYNASPDSVIAALGVLKNIETDGRRFSILGGMRELGDYAKKGHIDCGAVSAGIADFLYVFGENAEFYVEGAKKAGMDKSHIRCFNTKNDLAEDLIQTARPGDVLLFKGSRAMKMEEVPKLIFGEKTNEI